MKKEFYDFVMTLINENPDRANELMTDTIKAYLDVLNEAEGNKPELTENGKPILAFLQHNSEVKLWKAKDIAEQMGLSSRGVSGAMRKLVTSGFCEKIGKDPSIYCLTEKGKNFEII